VLVDGSWESNGRAEIAMVIYNADDELYAVQCTSGQPKTHIMLIAEAKTMLDAYRWTKTRKDQRGWMGATIVTVCMAVVQAIKDRRAEGFPSRQAFQTLEQAAEVQAEMG
jgi:hypothetical protein